MKMARLILDVTRPISPQLSVWPGDPPVAVTPLAGARESYPRVSHISLGSHTGTHVDPPAHFIAGGLTVERLDLDILLGPAWLMSVPGPGPITAQALDAGSAPSGVTRLLIRTNNSAPDAAKLDFDPDFVALSPDAARWVLARGIRLVGIDGPSIAPFGDDSTPVHLTLLEAGVIVVEGLELTQAAPGPYELICLPLAIAGGDGAPARVLLIRNPAER